MICWSYVKTWFNTFKPTGTVKQLFLFLSFFVRSIPLICSLLSITVLWISLLTFFCPYAASYSFSLRLSQHSSIKIPNLKIFSLQNLQYNLEGPLFLWLSRTRICSSYSLSFISEFVVEIMLIKWKLPCEEYNIVNILKIIVAVLMSSLGR